MHKKAFTLMEVIVSIAILIILMGLMLSVTQSSVSRAKDTRCLLNMKQIYTAMQLYEGDYGSYPNALGQKGLVPYFAGSIPVCWAPGSDSGKPIVYFVYVPDIEIYPQIERNCFVERGGEFPIVQDVNHLTAKQVALTHQKYMFVVRLNGSATRTKGSYNLPKSSLPCPGASSLSNN